MKKEKGRLGVYLALHGLLVLFSFVAVLNKVAGREPFLSFRFLLFYGTSVFILGVYALLWQQIMKRLPLTMAYANKAVTVVWGLLWGWLFFEEKPTVTKIIGAVVIIAGVVLYAFSSDEGGERDA